MKQDLVREESYGVFLVREEFSYRRFGSRKNFTNQTAVSVREDKRGHVFQKKALMNLWSEKNSDTENMVEEDNFF